MGDVEGSRFAATGPRKPAQRVPTPTPRPRFPFLPTCRADLDARGWDAVDIVIVSGQRNGQPFRLEVDLPSVFAAGGRDKDIFLLNGDAVWVDRQPMVYIYGEVQRPGPLRLERDLTLMQALATGGGLTQRGTEKGIRVHRKGPTGTVQVIETRMDDKLRDGDVVFVRESLF